MKKDNAYFQTLKDKVKTFLGKNVNTIDESNLYSLDECTYLSTPDVREEYYYLNQGVGTCIQIKRVPEYISRNILIAFKGIPNIKITIDFEHIPNRTLTSFLSKNIKSLKNEGQIMNDEEERDDVGEKINAEVNFKDYIRATNENGKNITLRIYVSAENLEHLQYIINSISEEFKRVGLYGAVQRNLLDFDLKALTSLSNTVKDIVTTKSLANMMITDNVQQIDPYMFAIGETERGRPYCPDFIKYGLRSYAVCVIGPQGCGKSSLIKLMMQSALMRKEQVVIIDVHNHEYEALANRYHVPSICLEDGNYINPYQIYNNDEKQGVITRQVIADVVMLNRDIFIKLIKEEDTAIISMYVNLLTEMYKPFLDMNVDSIQDNCWFIGSDILKKLNQKIKDGEYPVEKLANAYKLQEHMISLVESYGFFFDENTNIKFDITKSFRVDVSSLESNSSEVLKNAYLGLIFSFLGKVLRHNETINKELEEGMNPIRPAHPLTVGVEETGTLLKEIATCKILDVFSRQLRKSRAQFLYAFHTINDIDGGNSEQEKLVKSVFTLCPNFIIGAIDTETASKLPNYIKGLTKEDTSTALGFVKKDNDPRRKFLAYTTDNDRRIVFYSKVSKRQAQLFGGGR